MAHHRFLFHVLPYSGSPSNTPYQHTSIALAEGLRELGVPFYGVTRFWYDRELGEYLFEESPEDYAASVHVYSYEYVSRHKPVLAAGKIHILLDDSDGLDTAARDAQNRSFSLILRTHYNREITYLPNVKPWAFGLSNRLIAYNRKYYSLPTVPHIFSNLRVQQNIRVLAVEKLLPLLSTKYPVHSAVTDSLATKENASLDEMDYWNQTGRRHNEEYFKMLNQSLITFAFGGISEYKPVGNTRTWLKKASRLGAKMSKVSRLPQQPYYYVHNFDNWRFWEALVSNTCPVALDFDYWQCVYPEMPQPGVHYIGVRDFDFAGTARQVTRMTQPALRQVAEAGKSWALQHYSPAAVANRLLRMIETELPAGA